jgi:non-ribosomal peptide synthetase component F
MDFQPTGEKSSRGEFVEILLPGEMIEKFKKMVMDTQTTVYIVLLAAYNILLSRYTGADEILVATPTAGRAHADVQKIMGVFVNMLAMKNNPRPGLTFKEFLKEVKQNSLEAYENQDYQFDELNRQLRARGHTRGNSLDAVVFDYKNIETFLENNQTLELPGITLKPSGYEHTPAKFDLLLNVYDTSARIRFKFTYRTQLFKRETIEKISRRLIEIIRQIIENPGIKIVEILILDEQEREQMIQTMRNRWKTVEIDQERQQETRDIEIEAEFQL